MNRQNGHKEDNEDEAFKELENRLGTIKLQQHYDLPVNGDIYIDYKGREFMVNEVDPRNRLGREVQGEISCGEGAYDNYSCTLEIWRNIWRDKSPRIQASEMRIG